MMQSSFILRLPPRQFLAVVTLPTLLVISVSSQFIFSTPSVFVPMAATQLTDFPRSSNPFLPSLGSAERQYHKATSEPLDPAHPNRFIINLKRDKNQPKEYNKHKGRHKVEAVLEMECSLTMFMTPFHHPVLFSQNTSIYSRMDKSCVWKFIGTEPCIPIISCDTSHLNRECDKEYLEIVDGSQGFLKVCRNESDESDTITHVANISASDGMRDLFIRFRVLKTPKEWNKRKILFNCTVKCSKRFEGIPLEKTFHPKINPRCFCGTKPNEDRIVGGEVARKFEYPWMVALVQTNTRQPFCGGSIINNRFVLTAAHCIRGRYMDYRNIQVVVNGHEFDSSPNSIVSSGTSSIAPKTYSIRKLEKLDRLNGSKRYNIDEVIVHPLFVIETNDYDLALLKLQEDIDMTPKTRSPTIDPHSMTDNYLQQPRAICLPEVGSYNRTYSNKKAVISGWGLADPEAEGTAQVLQKLEVKVFSPQTCKEMFAHRVNRRSLCAGHAEGGKDSCAGDSGGPLVLEDRPKVWTQIGSVSWGEGCGQAYQPGVYFRVTEGVQWITYHSNFDSPREENSTDGKQDAGATWCLNPP